MEFEIGFANQLGLTDSELSELLYAVYVDEGYVTAQVADTIFEPSLVRARGAMFVARECSSFSFVGMVIVVPPDSPAKKFASESGSEMQLLGVKPKYRRCKVGRTLVEAALNYAKKNSWDKMILWTQEGMGNAQNLYQSFGFEQIKKMKKNKIEFLVYEKSLNG